MNMHSSMVPGLLPARFLISALLPLIQEICNDKTEDEIPLFIAIQLYEYVVAQWLLWLVLSKESRASIELFWLTVGGTQQCIKYLAAQWLLNTTMYQASSSPMTSLAGPFKGRNIDRAILTDSGWKQVLAEEFAAGRFWLMLGYALQVNLCRWCSENNQAISWKSAEPCCCSVS